MQREGYTNREVERVADELLALLHGDTTAAARVLANRAQQGQPRHVESALSARQFDGPPVVSLQEVHKTYKLGKQTVQALRGVTLDIYKGEMIAIVGPSGSGKSTLLQLIGCLDTPTAGSVTVDGQMTTKLNDRTLSLMRRSTIGFIFQSFYLQPFLRLGANVGVPAMFAGKRAKDIAAETSDLLEKVGLNDRQRHFPKELSGGQIQRAAIARALINKPKIILADEPTGNLDAENSKRIVELFQTIRDQLGTTVVIVTHNADVAQYADRTITLNDGGIV